MCDSIYRWNNEIYSSSCPMVRYQYSANGMIPPSPYYFCVTIVDQASGNESKMSPIKTEIASGSFNFVDIAAILPQKHPNGLLQIFASYENEYFYRLPVVEGSQQQYMDEEGRFIHQVTVDMLHFRGEVVPYNGQLSMMNNGQSNVVLENCGGNGERLETEIYSSTNLMHYPDNLVHHRCGGYWEDVKH